MDNNLTEAQKKIIDIKEIQVHFNDGNGNGTITDINDIIWSEVTKAINELKSSIEAK